MTLGETLRREHAEALHGFLHHEFFDRVQEGTLTDAERDAYFAYEHRFVEQAVVVLAHLLTKAPTTEARKHIVMMLNGLVTDQIALFESIFSRIDQRPTAMPKSVVDFCEGMTAIARDGSYAQGIAAMLAAEWTYAEVSRRLATTTVADQLLRDWFNLHTEPAFLEGVRWLENELDSAAKVSVGVPPAALSTAFLRAVALEIDFHKAPLRLAK